MTTEPILRRLLLCQEFLKPVSSLLSGYAGILCAALFLSAKDVNSRGRKITIVIIFLPAPKRRSSWQPTFLLLRARVRFTPRSKPRDQRQRKPACRNTPCCWCKQDITRDQRGEGDRF